MGASSRARKKTAARGRSGERDRSARGDRRWRRTARTAPCRGHAAPASGHAIRAAHGATGEGERAGWQKTRRNAVRRAGAAVSEPTQQQASCGASAPTHRRATDAQRHAPRERTLTARRRARAAAHARRDDGRRATGRDTQASVRAQLRAAEPQGPPYTTKPGADQRPSACTTATAALRYHKARRLATCGATIAMESCVHQSDKRSENLSTVCSLIQQSCGRSACGSAHSAQHIRRQIFYLTT